MTPNTTSSATPLAGRRIAITRAREQAGELREKLAALGATVLELPLVQFAAAEDPQDRDEVFAEIAGYEWIVFSSPNGVRFFFGEFFRKFRDIRALGGARIAAVGPGTAKELEALHLEVDVVPQQHVGEALVEALCAYQSMEHVKVLVVTGDRNRDVIVTGLNDAQAIVDQIAIYHTASTDLSGDNTAAEFRQGGADAILFASGSAVQSFIEQAATLALRPGAKRPLAGSLGPVTSEAMRQAKLPVDFEAAEATMDGFVAAVVKKLAAG